MFFIQLLGSILFASYLIYSLLSYWHSRKLKPNLLGKALMPQELSKNYVFLVPSFKQEYLQDEIILGNLENLLLLDEKVKVVLIDDSSMANTSQLTQPLKEQYPERFFALHRELPQARQGRAAALNWAARRLSRLHIVNEDTIVAVCDAETSTSRELLLEAERVFGNSNDNEIVAAQAHIRIRTQSDDGSLKAKLLLLNQDLESYIWRGSQLMRQSWGLVALADNGQFLRWSYMNDTIQRGEEVWPDSQLSGLAASLKAGLLGKHTAVLEAEAWQNGYSDWRQLLQHKAQMAEGSLQQLGQLGRVRASERLSRAAKWDLTYLAWQMPLAAALLMCGIPLLLFGLSLPWLALFALLGAFVAVPAIWTLSYVRENPKHKQELLPLMLSVPVYLALLLLSVGKAWWQILEDIFVSVTGKDDEEGNNSQHRRISV